MVDYNNGDIMSALKKVVTFKLKKFVEIKVLAFN